LNGRDEGNRKFVHLPDQYIAFKQFLVKDDRRSERGCAAASVIVGCNICEGFEPIHEGHAPFLGKRAQKVNKIGHPVQNGSIVPAECRVQQCTIGFASVRYPSAK
jgi:hypothetical protein